jgi:hypothetical protein
VTLHAFTSRPHLVEHFAPVRLSKMTPEWWKNTPLHLEPDRRKPPNLPPHVPPPSRELALTVKHCYAIRELFSRAVLLRLWADYVVMVAADGRTSAHCPMPPRYGEQHPPTQYPGMLNGWAHYKFMCPWLLYTDEPLHFYYTHPFYQLANPGRFQVMPGVTEFHWQNHAHANCVFPVGNTMAEVAFSAGAPMAYLIPMDDVNVTVKAEQVSEHEYESMIATRQVSFHHHRLSRDHDITLHKARRWRWWPGTRP